MIDDDEPRTRILVVDDHDLMAETLRRALTVEPDFAVVGRVASVASAVEAAALSHPDVIVMDFLLPDGTGAEATALIKADCPSIEVVMVTGQSNPATLAQALESGCSGFVAKEGRFDDLIETIRAVVRGEVRVPRSLVEELATHLRPRAPSLGSDLTTREREILALLASGRSTSQMVDELVVSVHTVRNHVRNILTKLQSSSRLEAVAVATRLGLLPRSSGGTPLIRH
jgi:DNA-binding NarL/FixJ family response regulator